ncbi:MAG: twin-arginine translocation signal domain-containing protein, partial [Olsenella sp.]|nr:twin-arginine translocation signal domain-containing protein [Olsenella sp.]
MLYDNVSRRSFLKLSGATAAVAGLGLAACGNSGSTGSTKD